MQRRSYYIVLKCVTSESDSHNINYWEGEELMLAPLKDENLDKNMLVTGSYILRFLKGEMSVNLEELYQQVKKINQVGLEQFYNTITFLWMADLIECSDYEITYGGKDVLA